MKSGNLQVTLEQKDVRILVQSLTNCLATCHAKDHKPDAPCEDCAKAAELKSRLEKLLS